MTLPEMQAIAYRVNTGTDNPETSRALIVFNQTDQRQSGVAVFHAAMAWPANQTLPPVTVTTMEGWVAPAAMRELSEAPDLKGRADRRQLSFALHFAVTDVPAQSWQTYIASYADAPSPLLANTADISDFIVVETTRHGGDLPSMGNF